MSRYVPKTYNNRRLLRIVIGAIAATALSVLLLFILLFFGLQVFIVEVEYGPPTLEIPFLMENPPPRDENAQRSPLGFFIGAATAAGQFWVLTRVYGSSAHVKRSVRTTFFIISQFLVPLIVLLSSTLLLEDGPMLVGVGMLLTLAVLSVGEKVYERRNIRKMLYERTGKNL